MKPKGPKDPKFPEKTDCFYPPKRKRKPDILKPDQAFPLDDEDDPENECYKYLRQVNEQASTIDRHLEDQKHEEYVLTTTPYVKPTPVAPVHSKGIGLSECDLKWKEETLFHYKESQKTLLMRRDEIRENYPELMYQCDHSLESLVMNQQPEQAEDVASQSKYISPGMDDVARCSEGFIHY